MCWFCWTHLASRFSLFWFNWRSRQLTILVLPQFNSDASLDHSACSVAAFLATDCSNCAIRSIHIVIHFIFCALRHLFDCYINWHKEDKNRYFFNFYKFLCHIWLGTIHLFKIRRFYSIVLIWLKNRRQSGTKYSDIKFRSTQFTVSKESNSYCYSNIIFRVDFMSLCHTIHHYFICFFCTNLAEILEIYYLKKITQKDMNEFCISSSDLYCCFVVFTCSSPTIFRNVQWMIVRWTTMRWRNECFSAAK